MNTIPQKPKTKESSMPTVTELNPPRTSTYKSPFTQECNYLVSSFFSSSNPCIFFLRDGKDFICLLHGLQVADSVVWYFLNMWIPLTILTVGSTLIVSMGRAHLRNPKMKLQADFKSQAVVCKNIYAGFIQFLLEYHWKPM